MFFSNNKYFNITHFQWSSNTCKNLFQHSDEISTETILKNISTGVVLTKSVLKKY